MPYHAPSRPQTNFFILEKLHITSHHFTTNHGIVANLRSKRLCSLDLRLQQSPGRPKSWNGSGTACADLQPPGDAVPPAVLHLGNMCGNYLRPGRNSTPQKWFLKFEEIWSYIYIYNIYIYYIIIYIIIFLDVYHSLWLKSTPFWIFLGGSKCRTVGGRVWPAWVDWQMLGALRCSAACRSLDWSHAALTMSFLGVSLKNICCVDHFWRNHDGWWNIWHIMKSY